MLHGDRISDDEATLIRQCASELLEKIPLHPKAGLEPAERMKAVKRSRVIL
jgi:hypothetical protein